MTASPVAEVVEAAGAHVPGLLARAEQRLLAIAAGHGEVVTEHAGATIAAGGKRLRPLLVLLAGGETADEDALLRAAVAVELVHAATLVHDDVLDDAPLRRGRATVHAVAGPRMATAVGDLLFAAAFSELVAGGDAGAVCALSAAATALARGELLQRADAWDVGVPVDRYLRRCELKTARLFEAACELGRRAAGAEPTALEPFARGVGLAFQLLDDVLDVAGAAERTGKHRGTDLLDGTVTLPLILARERDPWLADLDPRSITTAEHAEAVCDRIEATGALAAARAHGMRLVEEAKASLPADLAHAQRQALLLVADGVVARSA